MFLQTHRKKVIYFGTGFYLALLVVGSFSYSISLVYGGSSQGNYYYGGKINKVTYCTCYYDFGVVLEIEDKSNNNQTLKVFYSPYQSRLRANYNIWRAGPNVIGGYNTMNKECKMTRGWKCSSDGNNDADGVIDYIKGIGSSLQ